MLDAIGGKRAPEVEAQRKRYDAFVDKAAAEEDFDELRDKKRMRSEEVHAPAPSDPASTGASSSSSSSHVAQDQNPRGANRMSEDDGRIDLDEAQIGMAKRATESGLEIMRKRGEKRMETTSTNREVRAKIPEARGQKRISEDDGRADLDSESDIFKNTRVGAIICDIITQSAARWCDIVDDTGLDPLLNLDSWKMPSVHERSGAPRKTYVDLENWNDVRSEGRALREAPHGSREPDTRAESEFEPSRIDHSNDEVRLRLGGSF